MKPLRQLHSARCLRYPGGDVLVVHGITGNFYLLAAQREPLESFCMAIGKATSAIRLKADREGGRVYVARVKRGQPKRNIKHVLKMKDEERKSPWST